MQLIIRGPSELQPSIWPPVSPKSIDSSVLPSGTRQVILISWRRGLLMMTYSASTTIDPVDSVISTKQLPLPLQPFADGRDENSVGFIEAQPAMNIDKMTAETSAFVPILTLPGSKLDNRRTRN